MSDWPEYICGKSFANVSKWVLCDRYQIKFNSEQIQENDLVFLNLELFNHFVNHIYNNRPRHKFILITFNSDKSFTDYHFGLLKDFVVKIYAMNNTVKNDMVKYVPIGFRDWPNETRKEIKEVGNIQNKHILLYMNFVIQTNIQKRTECFNVMNQYWVTKKKDIPVIIVNSWEEVTENFLLHNYETYYNKLINWKKENDWLSPNYWLNR